MEEKQIAELLIELWRDIQQPAIFWQVGVLALCLIVAGLVSRQVRNVLRRRRAANPELQRGAGEEGLRRVIFPLTALGLVLIARVVLSNWHRVNLFKLAVPLLLAMAVIRRRAARGHRWPRAGGLHHRQGQGQPVDADSGRADGAGHGARRLVDRRCHRKPSDAHRRS